MGIEVNEIVATTFSGKVFAFWDTRTLDLNDPKIREMKEKTAKVLQTEVNKLKEKVATASASRGEEGIKLGENVQPANARMTILPSDAAYLLTVESQSPIVFLSTETTIP